VVSLSGIAHGGQQPIVGSTVTVYAAGNAGLGSAATALSSTTTDSNGNFYFGAANSNTFYCPSTISSGAPTASDTIYIVASGGQPTPGVPNADAVEMSVVGDCRNLENAQTFVEIDESSTFSSMTALQQFFNPTTQSFGAPSSNLLGLSNAALTAGNLLSNVHTVAAPSGADASVTGATVTITPEISKMNLGADILATCINSNPSTSNTCTTLFNNAGSGTPTNTLQAAYYMATTPAGVGTAVACSAGGGTVTAPSICTLFSLVNTTSPFQPIPSAAPVDWTVGVTYGTSSLGTGTGTPYLMNSPEYIAIDGQGDVWIANYASTAAASSITELSPAGAPMKQALNSAFLKASAMAIDPFGNVYVSNAGATSIVEYTTAGATNTYTTTIAPYSLTIDGMGNVFEIGKSGTVIQEIPAGSSSGTTPTTVTTGLTTTYPALTVDKNFNLWLATGTTVDEMLYNTYGTVHSAGSVAGLTAPETISIDASNNIWAGNYSTTVGSLSEITANNTGSSFAGTSYSDPTGLYDNKMVTSDSAGNIFTANSHSSTGGVVAFKNNGTLISPAAGFAHTYYYSQSAAVDAAGNVWVGSEQTPGATQPFITEIVGVAAPTVTPIASNIPNTPTSTSKSTLSYSSVPNVYAIPGTAASYSPTLSSTNAYSTTGTFTLVSQSGALCIVTGSIAPGGTVSCIIPGTATASATPGTYTGTLNFSGDTNYYPSSTPVTIILEPAGGISTGSIQGNAISGIGNNPKYIVGATATLWATANNGVATQQTGGEIDAGYYKGQAVALATTITNSTGVFSFTNVGCASPDQLYVTVSGGQVNGNANNPDILLMAALGPCNGPTFNLNPYVDEATTVAAAYALAPFISITKATPSSGNPYFDVNITASATNYATATQTTGTMYHPVGLQHAFLNAANLASVQVGTAQTSLNGYSGTTVPILPYGVINSVANVLTACVQTVGTCTNIFAGAIPLTTGSVPLPTNTLAAALNVARNPYLGGAGAAATWLNFANGGPSPYTPALTVSGAGTTAALPHDLSAAIIYPSGLTNSSTSTALLNLYGVLGTMDANDEFYLLSESTSPSPYYYGINGFASNGTNVMHHLYCQTSYTYNQTTCPEPLQTGEPNRMAADQLGDIWLVQYGTASPGATFAATTGQSTLIQITASTGAFANIPANTSTQMSTYIAPIDPISVAVDQNNDVWVGSTNGAVTEFVNGSSTPTTSVAINQTAAGTAMATETNSAYTLAFDGQQNLIFPGESTTANTNSVWTIPNTALTSTTYPALSAGAIPALFTAQGSSAPHTSTLGDYGYSLAFDTLGNIYEDAGTSTTAGTAGDGINVLSRTYTGNTLSGFTAASSLITGAALSTTNGLINALLSRPQLMTQDGSGAIFFPDYAVDSVVRLYGPTGTSVLTFYPCVGTTCSTVYASGQNLFAGKQAFVDSSGDVVVFTTTNGNWAQVFGIGTPSFPLAQTGHPGQMP
jgi:hypothetical protein